MRKFLFQTMFLCVALTTMAATVESTTPRTTSARMASTRGSALTTRAPQRWSSADLEGYRIAISKCYGFDEETGVLDTVPIDIGWKIGLSVDTTDSIEYLTAQQLYGHFDFPIDIDEESGTAILYYNYASQSSSSASQGRYRYDTIRTVAPISWAQLMGDEENCPDVNIGTIQDDGSIVFNGDFVFLTEVVTTKTVIYNNKKVTEDTAYFVSPVYRQLSLMTPNGVHRFDAAVSALGSGVVSDAVLDSLGRLVDTSILTGWFNTGDASTMGVGGIIGKPIDPRKPQRSPRPRGLMNNNGYTSSHRCLAARALSLGTVEEPIYMFQQDDSTIIVYNMFGSSVSRNVLKVHEDCGMVYEPQMMGYDNQGSFYNGSLQDGQIVLGNTGSVVSDTIVWHSTFPIYDNGTVQFVEYRNNKLYYTDGNQFVYDKSIPPVITTEVTDASVIITASADESVIVLMTADGTVVDNPYIVERGQEDQTVVVKASAQQYGKLPSEWVTQEVLVPARKYKAGDVNRDGRVSIKDVTDLIDMLLTGEGD